MATPDYGPGFRQGPGYGGYHPRTGLDIGITESSLTRYRGVKGQFAHYDEMMRIKVAAAMAEIGKAAEEEVKRQFIAGGHDRGEVMPPELTFPARPTAERSLDTLQVRTGPNWAQVTIGGGAIYVEMGTKAHPITVSGFRPGVSLSKSKPNLSADGGTQAQASLFGPGAQALHWIGPGGADMFAKSVFHKAYAGDQFIERAADRLDLLTQINRITSWSYVDVIGR